ncbi:hypothetical protein, partial [Paraburkholderia sabiae]|uniref:hypothetical protein n=1 Tax=Paraburkholderia sabiae TaxID=273251 RepID=UPI003CCC8A34
REASPPIYTCLALIPAGSSAIRLPRPSTLVQRILNGSHATLTPQGAWQTVLSCQIKPSPFEQQVRIDVVAAGDQRHRRARLERLFNKLPSEPRSSVCEKALFAQTESTH